MSLVYLKLQMSSSKKRKRSGQGEKIGPEEVAQKVKDVAKTIRET